MSNEEYKPTLERIERSREIGGSYDDLVRANEKIKEYREKLREDSQEGRK